MTMGSLRFWLLALVLLPLAGCASYKLGPTGDFPAGSRSVTVQFFQNQTQEPRLLESVNQSIRAAIQRDGTFHLDTHGDGTIVISGEIIRFDRAPISFQPNDVLTVRDYDLSMTAHVIARERTTGRVVMEKNFNGRSTIRTGSDLSSAERQAIPLMAEDLATRIVEHLADGKWW